jgi:hypothetical protein
MAPARQKNHRHDRGIVEIIHFPAKLIDQPPIRMFNTRN